MENRELVGQGPRRHLLDASMFWAADACGGVRRVIESKRNWLRASGWQHTLLAPGAQGPDDLDCGGLPIPRSGGYRFVLARERAARQIEAVRPDLIEAADPYVLGWAVRDAAARLGVPAVAFCHSDLPRLCAGLLGSGRASRWAFGRSRDYLVRLYGGYALVLAPSRGLCLRLRGWGLTNVLHQPLGVDGSVFRPQAGDPAWRARLLGRLELPVSTRLLVYAGRFASEKRLELLSQAVAMLGAGHALLLVGAGPCPPRPAAHLRLLAPMTDRVRLARLLASSDLFVHAGEQETFGLAALEAMACGTPVVVAGGGALGELVGGDAGLRVEEGHPAAWAAAMDEALHDRGGAQRIERALARAAALDWRKVLLLLTLRYQALLESQRQRA